jgi:hypothetical protein
MKTVPVSCSIMCDKEADLAEHAAHRRPSRLRGRVVAAQHTGLGTENRLSEPCSGSAGLFYLLRSNAE